LWPLQDQTGISRHTKSLEGWIKCMHGQITRVFSPSGMFHAFARRRLGACAKFLLVHQAKQQGHGNGWPRAKREGAAADRQVEARWRMAVMANDIPAAQPPTVKRAAWIRGWSFTLRPSARGGSPETGQFFSGFFLESGPNPLRPDCRGHTRHRGRASVEPKGSSFSLEHVT